MNRRLSELAATLSLAADAAHGASFEHQLRAATLAARLGAEVGLSPEEHAACYDTALLRWLGCTATAQMLSGWMGDEIAAHRATARFDAPLDPLLELVRAAGAGRDLPHRLLILLDAVRAGPRAVFGAGCEATVDLSGRLGYPAGVVRALEAAFEHVDGTGWPSHLAGDAVPVASQVAAIADDLVTLCDLHGLAAARDTVRGRAAKHYAADLVRAAASVAPEVVAGFQGTDAWVACLEADPSPDRTVPAAAAGDLLTVVADFVDLKVPGLAGHSRGVAQVAAKAAEALGEEAPNVTLLRHAALVHDLGRLTVPNNIWSVPGPLSSAQKERVRLCPHYAERFCARSPWLAGIAGLGTQHQERLDGSGYHRGTAGAAIGRPARILQAADCYRALTEDRAHRPALAPEAAAAHLRAEARAGRFDPAAVEAVIGAAGQRALRRRSYPAGLTSREVEVLGLLAQGLPNKQIASVLVVSNRTVGTHVAHIYDKIGVATRAGATLFALRHDLVQTSVKQPM